MRGILAPFVFVLATTLSAPGFAADTASLWRPHPGALDQSRVPSHYVAYTLDFDSLKHTLDHPPVRLALPGPDGVMRYFDVGPAEALPATLAAKYPDIRSYQGNDGQGRRVRLDLSSKGLKAAVYGDPKGVWLVQRAATLAGDAGGPATAGDVYVSFARNDLPSPPGSFREGR